MIAGASIVSRGAGSGWLAVVREPNTGAWQRNEEIPLESALQNPTVFACVTLIAGDIGKLRLRLVALDENGIWTETESAAFSPVLRSPNRYQLTSQFLETWLYSKLLRGNTYVLKARDNRRVVSALYVLNPACVTPLVTPDGGVYYQLAREELAGVVPESADPFIVPASEIIHDRWNCFWHPLIGVSPLYACGGAAWQGLTIQQMSTTFFRNGAQPGGLIMVPGKIAQDSADRLKAYWSENFAGDNAGKVALLSEGMKYEPLAPASASDQQLTEQLTKATEAICSAYHIPVPLIDASIQPPYGNSPEPLLQLYYSQCLQTIMNALEASLDAGLELPSPYGTEFDIDDLVWMDTGTKTKAAQDGITGGGLAPNEARKKYFGLGPVAGGEAPYLQQQNYSLEALAKRDAGADPFARTTPAPADDQGAINAAFAAAVKAKALEKGWRADAA
jgi:HK97 family phage portal protein